MNDLKDITRDHLLKFIKQFLYPNKNVDETIKEWSLDDLKKHPRLKWKRFNDESTINFIKPDGKPLTSYRGCLDKLLDVFTINGSKNKKYNTHTTSSTDRGILVDQEIQLYAVLGNIIPSDMKFNSFTLELIKYWRKNNIEIKLAQYFACDGNLKLFSHIDCIGEHRETGETYLYEIKTGYDHNYKEGNNKMEFPFNDNDDSDYHVHQLQLFLYWIFIIGYYDHVPNYAQVLKINATSGLEVIPLKTEWSSNLDIYKGMYEAILNWIPPSKRKKPKKPKKKKVAKPKKSKKKKRKLEGPIMFDLTLQDEIPPEGIPRLLK